MTSGCHCHYELRVLPLVGATRHSLLWLRKAEEERNQANLSAPNHHEASEPPPPTFGSGALYLGSRCGHFGPSTIGLVARHGCVPRSSLDALRLNTPPGDSHASPGMVKFGELIEKIHPGIFIHSVYIEEDQEQDRRASFVR